MQVVSVPIDSIFQDPNNARKHNKKNLSAIKASYEQFGSVEPLIVRKETNIIIGGNGRHEVLKKLGHKNVDVVFMDVDEKKANAMALALNKTGDLSDFDSDILAEQLKLLQDDFSLADFGFDMPEVEEENTNDPDEVPEENNVELRCAIGDIWQLGDHRLMCGDSTDELQIKKLMNNSIADINFSSPPYNVGKTPNGNDKKYLNDSDNKNETDFFEFLIKTTRNSLLYSEFSFINIQSLSGNKISLINYLYAMQDKYADTIIWDKTIAEPAMAKNVLNSQFEYIHVFSEKANRAIGTKVFRGTLSNLVQFNSRKDKEYSKIHKATFPVEFAEFFVENFSTNTVLDLFGGTGSTLIACEKTKRKCFMIEIFPTYCDIIITRWEKYSGKKAVKYG